MPWDFHFFLVAVNDWDLGSNRYKEEVTHGMENMDSGDSHPWRVIVTFHPLDRPPLQREWNSGRSRGNVMTITPGSKTSLSQMLLVTDRPLVQAVPVSHL